MSAVANVNIVLTGDVQMRAGFDDDRTDGSVGAFVRLGALTEPWVCLISEDPRHFRALADLCTKAAWSLPEVETP